MTNDFEQEEEITKINMDGVPEELVFGLDIGTRSIVGTVGYKNSTNGFVVVAQTSLEHETRAMMDGQIHDINMVAGTIKKIHERLEAMTGRSLTEVCIAAAGRVLKTVEAEASIDFATETVVTSEHIYTLDMLGVENAYELLRAQDNNEDIKFYCVGYSVKHYYQNDYPITNLEGHKCNTIKTEMIATFLPDEVVDGLYAAVERAGLLVANLTLEPIAAINVAIPERFRLLNIALVDVGAGTSDISITKDGSIIAYGMIPYAGDELTECLAKYYLTDFNEADKLKCASTTNQEVEFHDIMGLPQKVTADEVSAVVADTVRMITKNVADKIVELNGGKSVSAVFVVGGGGKVKGFVENLAEYLDIQQERVALRGSEVMGNIKFMQEDITVDSLLVTPVGICLNYYEQRNNFIFVMVNEERVKLYDNSRLTISDAAMQVGFPNGDLFPKRGKSITYYVNGEKRMLRGEEGEASVITLNGKSASISTKIEQNDKIEIKASTVGKDAFLEIGDLSDYKSTITIIFNGKELKCPRFVTVNGSFVSEFYEIKEEDHIEILEYYTLEQVLEFMDIIYRGKIYVNNAPATMEAKVYDNFSITCEILKEEPNYEELIAKYGNGEFIEDSALQMDTENTEEVSDEEQEQHFEANVEENVETHSTGGETAGEDVIDVSYAEESVKTESENAQSEEKTEEKEVQAEEVKDIGITVNGDAVVLKGKAKYILVDVLDFYPVDTAVAHGDHLETSVNGVLCDFMYPVKEGDIIKIEWVGTLD